MKMDLLPAEIYSNQIRDVIGEHQTVIICGETGCGKSTVIPQIILCNDVAGPNACIAVTQPRRVAASSLAAKVAHDRNTELGKEVGYKFRFSNVTSDETKLIYITDGMLLKEYANDNQLRKYACIILDEVHERSVSSDILIWCLRQVQIQRNESRRKLKLVLMSATMELEPLKKYFNAPAFYIPGRWHNVELFYCEKSRLDRDEHVENVVQTVLQLHESEPLEHAFLVFLTGQDEIETACKTLKRLLPPMNSVQLIPFYAQRRSDDTNDVFKIYKGLRKIIVATNIAETSITIPDVRVVIDSGKVKQKHYVHERRLSVLEVQPISKAQAIQRAGRAGRCADGKCYRLYSKAAYETLKPQATPEILRTSLSEILLNLFAASINTLKGFKFLDNPSEEEWCAALDELVSLELIVANSANSMIEIREYLELKNRHKLNLTYELTEMGQRVKRLPLSPMLSRFLVVSSKYGCFQEALIIAAFCSTDDFLLPMDSLTTEEQEQHKIFLRSFATPDGDFVRLCQVYRHYKKNSRNDRFKWCKSSGLNFGRLEEVIEIRKQLRDACDESKLDLNVQNGKTVENLKKAVADSFYLNACVYSMSDNAYKTLRTREVVNMHPSSCLFRQYPTTVVYTELIRTKKLYMRLVSPIDRSRIEERLKSLSITVKSFHPKNNNDKSANKSFVKELENF